MQIKIPLLICCLLVAVSLCGVTNRRRENTGGQELDYFAKIFDNGDNDSDELDTGSRNSAEINDDDSDDDDERDESDSRQVGNEPSTTTLSSGFGSLRTTESMTSTSLKPNHVVKYYGYSVLRVIPKSKAEVDYLKSLDLPNISMEIIRYPSEPCNPVDVMLPPCSVTPFKDTMKQQRLSLTTIVKDFQTLIDEEYNIAKEHITNTYIFPGDVGLSTTEYHNLTTIYDWLDKLATNSELPNNYCKLHHLTSTSTGNAVKIIQIGEESSEKKAVWLDGGLKGREWISIAAALYTIAQLARNDSNSRAMLQDHVFYILPVANPDGYLYTKSDRAFKKNRFRLQNQNCINNSWGIDLNRNFNYKFNTVSNPNFDSKCGADYRGVADKEIETTNIQNFLSVYLKGKSITLDIYISLQAYGLYWLTPFSYTTGTYPSNNVKLMNLAKSAIKGYTISPYSSSSWTVSPIAIQEGLAGGSPTDYAYHVAGAEYAYTVHLPGFDSFVVPQQKITQIVQQWWESFKLAVAFVKA